MMSSIDLDKPIVSVLMTAYNREKYIGEAIESVLQSSYQNFELIIVDDCSIDNTVKIVESYLLKDKRIKLFLNTQNLGDYPNRNIAASYASGEFLKYLDADDVMYEHTLSYMVKAMYQFPKAAMGISFNCIDDVKKYPHISTPNDSYQSEYLSKSVLGCGPSAAIIRRDIFEEMNGFSGKQFIGDHELWLKMAAKYDVVKLQPSLIWWRQHPDQQVVKERMNYSVQNIRYKHSLEVLENSKSFFEGDLFEQAKKNCKRNYARDIAKTFIKERNFKKSFTLWKLSGLSIVDFFKAIR